MIEVELYARQLEEIGRLCEQKLNREDEMNFLNRDTTKILRGGIFPVAHLLDD